MWPYYLLVALPFLLSVVQFESQARQMITKKKNWPILVFFGIYFLLLALRHVSVGVDTYRYLELYEQFVVTDWSNILNSQENEPGYVIVSKLASMIFDHPQFFLTVVAVITVIPLAKLYFEESENSMLTIALFLIFPVYLMNFSGLRQGMAISIGVIAFYAVKKKKLIPFILLVLLAMSFHNSAFILFLLYPLYHMRFRPVHLAALLPAYVLVYLFNEQIYRFIVPLLGEDYADRYSALTDTGAYTMIILMGLFLLYSFIVPNEELMDDMTVGLRNILVFALALQLFVPISRITMRMNYYYIVFIPLLIPRITNRWKRADRFITNAVNIVMIAFFLLYFLINANRVDNLGIYPYRPFWD